MDDSLAQRRLFNRLCVEFGFCLEQADLACLAAAPRTSVAAFTNAVFAAEGLDPESAELHLWRQVRDRVQRYYDETFDAARD